MALKKEYPRTYLDASFEPNSWVVIEPILIELRDRVLPDLNALMDWIQNWSEVEDVLDEAGVLREIAKDRWTQDDDVQRDHLVWQEDIAPKIKTFFAAFQQKVIDHPQVDELPSDYVASLKRLQNQRAIFHIDHVDLEAKSDLLVAEFFKLRNAQKESCDYGNPNRDQRENTFLNMVKRQAEDYDAMDDFLDQLLLLRQEMAQNAGCENFRDFRWRQLNRFDYSPEDCLGFVDAVEKKVVPYLTELEARRADEMGLASWRPWDFRADVKGRDALHPYETSVDLLRGVRQVVGSICPDFVEDFDFLVDNDLMDVESRPDKAGFVGYCQFLRARRTGFIFFNPKSVHRDIETFQHELGHLFHIHACRDQLLTWHRQVPLEFSEGVANGIQLIGGRFWEGSFYNAEDARRAQIAQLEGIVTNLVYTARGEAFLHWLHTNVGHTHKQRQQAWLDCNQRLGHKFDWSGLETYQPYTWITEIPHLFFAPFYWIEYLFGQVAALQLSRNFTNDSEETMAQLHRAMALGSTVSLPELFTTAGLSFFITPELLKELVQFIDRELKRLTS